MTMTPQLIGHGPWSCSHHSAEAYDVRVWAVAEFLVTTLLVDTDRGKTLIRASSVSVSVSARDHEISISSDEAGVDAARQEMAEAAAILAHQEVLSRRSGRDDTLQPIRTIVITRHESLVAWLKERGIIGDDALIASHIDRPEQIRGCRVIGPCPLHLAAEAYSVVHIPIRWDSRDERGRELTLEDVRERAGDPIEYVVRTPEQLLKESR